MKIILSGQTERRTTFLHGKKANQITAAMDVSNKFNFLLSNF